MCNVSHLGNEGGSSSYIQRAGLQAIEKGTPAGEEFAHGGRPIQ